VLKVDRVCRSTTSTRRRESPSKMMMTTSKAESAHRITCFSILMFYFNVAIITSDNLATVTRARNLRFTTSFTCLPSLAFDRTKRSISVIQLNLSLLIRFNSQLPNGCQRTTKRNHHFSYLPCFSSHLTTLFLLKPR
jgi:hypothetical protein